MTLPEARRTTTVVLLTVILTVGFTAATAAPAAATHNGEENDTLSDAIGVDDDGTIATISSIASGLSARVGYRARSLNPFSDVTPASEYANETAETFNQDSAELVDTANNHGLAGWFSHYSDRSNNVDVVRVEFTDPDGGEATRYLVAQYNATSDDYDSAEMTTSTDHAVDSYVELDPRATQNAPEDLDEFITEHAGNNSDLPKSYRRGLAAKYAGDVESPLIPDVGLREILRGL